MGFDVRQPESTIETDVAVIGGGSAGCAMAYRLASATAGPHVCVVEAGPDYGSWEQGRWPPDLLDPRRRPTTHDWGLVEWRGDGRGLPEPRARVIGGGSTHSLAAAVWGLPEDADRWARLTGDQRWCHRALRPARDAIEDAHGGDPTVRGRGGPVPTSVPGEEQLASWQRAVRDAALASGFPRLADLSSPAPADGVAPFQASIQDGRRWNAAFAFLDPVRASGRIRVLDRALADRVTFSNGRATVLDCRTADGPVQVRARQFVLAAGAYGSPAVLLRSGIGPAEHLASLGIPVVLDAPGVGGNLHDHPGVVIRYRPSPAALAALAEDLASGRFHQRQVAVRAAAGSLQVVAYQAPTAGGGWTFELRAFAMRPASRGQLRLADADPKVAPRIELNHLSDRRGHDYARLEEGEELIRRLANSPPLAGLAAEELDPRGSDLSRRVTGYGHVVGTCRMGPAGSRHVVTDTSGLVRGVANLWVADASLIPVIPAAHTNLTCMLIGWQIAGAVLAAQGAAPAAGR